MFIDQPSVASPRTASSPAHRWYVPGEPLLQSVDRHLATTGTAPSRWSRTVTGDAGYVAKLRKGRQPTRRGHLRALVAIGLVADGLTATTGLTRRDLRFYPAIVSAIALGDWALGTGTDRPELRADVAIAAALASSME